MSDEVPLQPRWAGDKSAMALPRVAWSTPPRGPRVALEDLEILDRYDILMASAAAAPKPS